MTCLREQVWKKARRKKVRQAGNLGCFSLGNTISGSKNLELKANPVKNVFKSGAGPQAMAEVSRVFLKQYKDEELAAAVKKFFNRFVTTQWCFYLMTICHHVVTVVFPSAKKTRWCFPS